ncbi:protease complex subunit PrcB family protein [Deinococcus aerophilus]|uniref:PrcB C-terminal domain-containing protein n=1 Tax=Deinococcus aerophilus TaxID=522488 RepID=A0ABQ2GLJ9_9DEIO|nr:protease complex subunit PrcB family protein [Deinococcus aerophilus]GGM02319.1 hypothetical protein GCM10010841_08550 [Deinococcus aerophilus]
MKKTLLPGLLLSVGLLSACTMTGPGNLKVHEALLYGGAQERIVWVYGTLSGGAAGSLKLGDVTADLRAQVEDPVAVPGTLSVNGKATYRIPTSPLSPPLNVVRRADGTFEITAPGTPALSAVYFTDGTGWSKLSGLAGPVRGVAVNGLQGVGQLTDAEAGVLSKALLGQGALAVGVLATPPAADAPLAVEPAPSEYRRTALYILPNVATVPGSLRPPAPTAPPSGGTVSFSELASGTQSGAGEATVQLATTPAAARALYATAYARQTGAPAAPDPNGGTLVGVFLGQRSTGGYGVSIVGARASGDTLVLTAQLRAPAPGAITTQALTSPWTIVRVEGTYRTVTVVDSQGQPLPSGGGSVR